MRRLQNCSCITQWFAVWVMASTSGKVFSAFLQKSTYGRVVFHLPREELLSCHDVIHLCKVFWQISLIQITPTYQLNQIKIDRMFFVFKKHSYVIDLLGRCLLHFILLTYLFSKMHKKVILKDRSGKVNSLFWLV